MVDDRKARILSIAEVDTLAAAEQVLELSALRTEAAAHGFTLPPDAAFDRSESAIRLGAAGIHYAAAEHALAQRARSGRGWSSAACQRYAPGYRDVVASAWSRRTTEATARVAILPLADQVDVPGLSRQLADRTFDRVSRHVTPGEFEGSRAWSDPGPRCIVNITVSRDWTGSTATAATAHRTKAGRRRGGDRAGCMACARRTSTVRRAPARLPAARRIRDTSGARPQALRGAGVPRGRARALGQRAATTSEVLDVRQRVERCRPHLRQGRGYARVVFTDFRADRGLPRSTGCYAAGPQGLGPATRGEIDREWKRHFGTWTLGSLLEKSRNDHSRTRYTSGDRGRSSATATSARCGWAGSPATTTMASISLDVVWQPVLGMLRELDPK